MNRRELLKLSSCAVAAVSAPAIAESIVAPSDKVQRWDAIELTHAGLRSLGLSIVTDMCLPDALEPVDIPQIIAVANAAEKKMRVLVKRVVAAI